MEMVVKITQLMKFIEVLAEISGYTECGLIQVVKDVAELIDYEDFGGRPKHLEMNDVHKAVYHYLKINLFDSCIDRDDFLVVTL